MIYIKLIPFCLFLVACSTKPKGEQTTVKNVDSLVVEQKRTPAKTVSPIIIDKVKYVSSLNEIIAFNTDNQIELWRKTIYDISYDGSLERDIQDIFIDSITFADNSLIIRNESNNWYFLELDSKKVYPNYSEIQKLEHQGYALSFSDSYETEFQHYKNSYSINKQLIKEQCIKQLLLSETSTHELNLKLLNGQFFTLKKTISDEQFNGYSFQYFDPATNLYIIWENWLEAGYPIAVNANNGRVIKVFGTSFSTNLNKTITANFADDLDSGWTPNGVQLLSIKNNQIDKLFEFNPIELLNENWGPVDVVWKNNSTIIIRFVKRLSDGKYASIYKQMKFEELKQVPKHIIDGSFIGNWKKEDSSSPLDPTYFQIKKEDENSYTIRFSNEDHFVPADYSSGVLKGKNNSGDFELMIVSETPTVIYYSDDGRGGHFDPIKNERFVK